MKQLAVLFLATLLCGACTQVPKKFVPGSTAAVHSSISETKRHVDSASGEAAKAKESIAKAKEQGRGNEALQLSLEQANGHIDALTQELLKANVSNATAETKLVEADKKTQSEFDRANVMASKYDKMATKYHRLKFIACLLGAAAVGFLVFQFKGLLLVIPPPYSFIAMGAAPVATFAILWAIF